MKQLTEFYKDKNILITGGAGFIGSHIAEELVNLGAKVTVLDNFSTGSLANLKNVITTVNIICADVRNYFACLNATKNIDIVFHLAALVSVPDSVKNPTLCKNINLDGTNNLLKSCVKNNVKTFIFSSSAAIYGNKNTVCNEKDIPNPESPYAQYKLESEDFCKKYSQEFNINTASLRYFNVYGQRQNPNGQYAAVVAKFKENLLNNKPLTIFGDGKQTRDFIHVSQVVKANLTIAMQGATQENLKGDIFNIASGKSINLLELIEQLKTETNKQNIEFKFEPARPGDIFTSMANCTKYKNLLKKYESKLNL
ncbi:NAD-dependent epimerase/dehydratase family protein [Candidatus Babeliales bacterium]|nr:NAD-dependent epimerase/dehydratase family protein [Candidatus Babeliales bacterium]MCF7899641.1 NAD-dependent epimerase/dehydratase family protein [Candidatus Babeliales bacterium]